MKRFFCTICKKNIRVRRLPDGVKPIEGLDGKPSGYTKGKCRWHDAHQSRAVLNNRVLTQKIAQPKASSAPAKKR